MRLILVKPTNATRRLDSTGEVFHNGGHEHCASGGPSPLTKSPEGMHDRFSATSVEASSSPQQTSPHCVSSAPNERSNGISPTRVSAGMSPLKTRNLTLSQLSDQDWLLLCGSVGDDSPTADRAGTSVGQPDRKDRCGCSCPDEQPHSEASSFHPLSKQGAGHDCASRVSNKKTLSSSAHSQPFSQSTQAPSTCQVLPQQMNHPLDDLMLKSNDREGQNQPLQQEQCGHFRHKDSQPTLFNIPLNSVEYTETNQKLHPHPQPAIPSDLNWRELFGKEPLLVQQCQKRDSHCSVGNDQNCKSAADPSVILQCCHLPSNPLTSTARAKRSSTPASYKGGRSLTTSQCSSFDNQDLMEGRARQRQRQVHQILFNTEAFQEWD